MKLKRLTEAFKLLGKSRSAYYKETKEGLMPPPVHLGPNSRALPEHEIMAINAARVAGKSNDEIRQLVVKLVADRKSMGVRGTA